MWNDYEDYDDEGYTQQTPKYRRGSYGELDSEEDDF